MTRWVVALVYVAVVGCSSHVDDAEPEPAEFSSRSSNPEAEEERCDIGVATTRADYLPPSPCSAVEKEVVGYLSTSQQLSALLTGQWLICGAPSAFGTSDEVGIEFTDDGR